MKQTKKGFTLIELLAVLVVLAILALIAVPIVIKVINEAREDSYKRSVEAYVRALNLAVTRWDIKHPNEPYSPELEEYDKDIIKGDQVHCQDFTIEENGKFTLGRCQTDKSAKSSPKLMFKYETGIVESYTKND